MELLECIHLSKEFDGKKILKDINNNRFTTKGQGHGFGLKLVKEIIKHNKNIELSTDLKKDNITGEKNANETHYNIGKNIREVIKKNGN